MSTPTQPITAPDGTPLQLIDEKDLPETDKGLYAKIKLNEKDTWDRVPPPFMPLRSWFLQYARPLPLPQPTEAGTETPEVDMAIAEIAARRNPSVDFDEFSELAKKARTLELARNAAVAEAQGLREENDKLKAQLK